VTSIKITSKEDYDKTVKYILDNGVGDKEIETDIMNCKYSLENNGVKLDFTSIKK